MFRQLGRDLLKQFSVVMGIWSLFLLFGFLLSLPGPIIQSSEGGRTGSMRGGVSISLAMTGIWFLFYGLVTAFPGLMDEAPRQSVGYRVVAGITYLLIGLLFFFSGLLFHHVYIHRW